MKLSFRQFLKESKNADIGIFIGRLQPPTSAHQKIIADAQKKYKNVYVFIIEGEKSSKDPKNFLSFDDRKNILKKTNPGVIPILSKHGFIPDIINENNIPTDNPIAIIAGSDRINGYIAQGKRTEDMEFIPDEIKRTENSVSATKVRKTLADEDYDSYKQIIAKGIDDKKSFIDLVKKYKRKNK